ASAGSPWDLGVDHRTDGAQRWNGDDHEQPFGRHRGTPDAAEAAAVSDQRIRLFLVDDHRLFLSGVRSELDARFDLVGEAGTVSDAVAGIVASNPDVGLLDVHMPDG